MPIIHSGLAESTKKLYEQINAREELSPRVRMALRMYANGMCNLTQAAEAMDLNVGALSLSKNSPVGKAFMQSAHEIIDQNATNTNALIQGLSVRAIQVIGKLMEDSASEKIQLDAAKDLADRGNETSKIQRMQVEAITLGAGDAKMLAEALVRGPRVQEKYAHLATGDFNRIEDGSTPSDSTPSDS
jgi:hypothetical protein